jgi:hypothetical protein
MSDSEPTSGFKLDVLGYRAKVIMPEKPSKSRKDRLNFQDRLGILLRMKFSSVAE